jgi:hypothetical protein
MYYVEFTPTAADGQGRLEKTIAQMIITKI